MHEVWRKLNTANVPQEERVIVIEPKFKDVFLQSAELTPASDLSDEVSQRGSIGNAGGLAIHVHQPEDEE